ncbi:MAG: phosphatidylglycerol---prolipoprotein diacylglyceryl transferase [Solirubrobacteraceae bacterium]|nr:phosphatidylglycerol---prolipoprotein diacylglyceryl transferase [Solirubrobacteraceae bacterium]
MLPEVNILGLNIQMFGVMLALALCSSGVLAARRLKELGLPVDWVYEMMFCAGAGGVAGAKLWYVVEKGDVGSLFSGTGLVFYGGAIGGALAVMAYARYRGFLDHRLFDMGAPGLAIGYAVGRLGCQLAGDGDYGIPSNLPWAMSYPDGTVPTTVRVHPTPIYEFLVMGAVTWWLWSRRDKARPGTLIGWWALLAGTERFLVEFIRRNDDIAGPFSLAQFVSVGLIVAGSWWLLRSRARAQSSATVPSPRSSAPRKARAAAASSSTPTPTDL